MLEIRGPLASTKEHQMQKVRAGLQKTSQGAVGLGDVFLRPAWAWQSIKTFYKIYSSFLVKKTYWKYVYQRNPKTNVTII